MTEQAHHLIKYFFIVHVSQLNPYDSLYLVILEATESLVVYNCAIGIYLNSNDYIYFVRHTVLVVSTLL